MKPPDKNVEEWLKQYAGEFAPVVPFAPGDKLLRLDFTAANTELTDELLKNTNLFIQYINKTLGDAGAKYGVGGYGEDRVIYRRSDMFGTGGPSPTAIPQGHDGAKAPSRWEGEKELESVVEEETVAYRFADPYLYRLLKEFVRQNRATPTQAETVLWEALKSKKFNEYKFRRQHIIDRFITDFVCLKKGLVIEVDGLIHELPENKVSDEERTEILRNRGFEVIRFTNDEVLFQIDNVLEKIQKALDNRIGPAPSSCVKETKAEVESSQSGHLSAGGLPTGKVGMGRNVGAEPRSIHLGLDIWGAPYTKVMAPLNGIVHSFAFNNAFGDYGATIILTHNLDDTTFHTLYGHLSLNSIKNMQEGDALRKGDVIAEFGIPFENGQWPPHLHFQLIRDMQGMRGDYPGVCAPSEKEFYLTNCPDADIIAGMMQYAD